MTSPLVEKLTEALTLVCYGYAPQDSAVVPVHLVQTTVEALTLIERQRATLRGACQELSKIITEMVETAGLAEFPAGQHALASMNRLREVMEQDEKA